MGMTVKEVTVTPEIAEEWFSNMATNRRLSESNLSAIVQAMKDGHWHNDGTPIRFNTEGKMIDGQHRCMAISITGQTHKFVVVEGVADEAMTTLDTGKSRSRSDVLQIHDPSLVDVVALSSTATAALRWEKGARGNSLRNFYVANDEFIRFFDANRESLLAANKTGRRIARHTRGVTAQAMALCAWLFERIDAEDAEHFWDRVIDGAGLDKGSPILALRRFFERESKSSRDNVRMDVAAAISIKAWNAYREGREVELLMFKVGGAKPERYPEPV